MAIETDKTGKDYPQDSTDHAIPQQVGDLDGPARDLLLVPGLGVCFSRHSVYELEDNAKKNAPKYKAFISEQTIRNWVRELDKYNAMEKTRNNRYHDHEKNCHEGTDAIDPEKAKSVVSKERDCFDVDKSSSRIGIHVTSGTRYLNGSAVKHQNYISMHFRTPDGRYYGDLSMTFDQFATALVSSSDTPCTWNHYWGVDDASVMLKEVVKIPDTISDRMEKRLANRLDDIEKKFKDISESLRTQIESGKALSKTKLIELQSELHRLQSILVENRNFTIEQSREEVTSIVEQAAISIAFSNDMSPEQLLQNSHVGNLIESLIKVKRDKLSASTNEGLLEDKTNNQT